MKLSIVVLQCFIASISTLDFDPTSSDTLVLLHVLFRHGNRTPDQTGLFPTDPNIGETYNPYGYSQLTKKGKATEYAIGRYLRETYGNFIPEQYTPDVVYALATNFKRTKMSLELVLAGLFPPLESDIFEDGFNWQPIPFLVEQDENLVGVPSIHCTNYLREYYRYILSKEGQQIMESYREVYEKLSNYTGLDVTTPDDIANIYATLQSEEDFGLTLPKWTYELSEILEDAAITAFEFATATPQLTRLAAGNLLKKIIEDSEKRERKIFLYSAHDFNMAVVLKALGVFERHMPPYGATLFFEVHHAAGVYGLKLYYQDYKQDEPKLLTIPGCASFCQLTKLKDMISDIFPGPYDLCTYSGELM